VQFVFVSVDPVRDFYAELGLQALRITGDLNP